MGYVYSFFLTLAVSSGVFCILITMFTSAKLARLIGRSLVYFGTDGDAAKIRKHGCRYFGVSRWDEHNIFKSYNGEPARLYAYGWYAGSSEWGEKQLEGTLAPESVVAYGFLGFKTM